MCPRWPAPVVTASVAGDRRRPAQSTSTVESVFLGTVSDNVLISAALSARGPSAGIRRGSRDGADRRRREGRMGARSRVRGAGRRRRPGAAVVTAVAGDGDAGGPRSGGGAVRGILGWEEAAILDLIETWGDVERSHRKLAHRTYTGAVFVSPSAVLRVALKHKVELPGEPFRPRPVMPALPQIPGAAAPLTCLQPFRTPVSAERLGRAEPAARRTLPRRQRALRRGGARD